MTSFFVKADPEFHQKVKDFYDSDFSESSADDKPEMSQEELRFLRELERTVVLRDGHYEMALPLKDREAPVPNNKPQVEQRALWLKGKLLRNKNLYNDYKFSWQTLLARATPARSRQITRNPVT